MDTLDWDATPITGSASYSLKNQEQQTKESLMISNSYHFTAPSSSRVNAFDQIQQQIANANSSQCHDIGDSSASLAMNLQEFGGAFDPIHILSSWKISQRREAATRLAAESVAAKSGTGSTADCTKRKIGSFFPQNNYMPQLGVCGVMADLGSNGVFTKSTSPDCLLSATNTSNTDTNDGVPVIFSNHSKTLLNNNNNTVSSGESAINAFNTDSSKHCNMAKKNHHHALLEPGASTKGFELISENDQPKSKKSRSAHKFPKKSSNINLLQASSSACSIDEPDSEAIAQMKEMIYRAAALRSVSSATEEVMVEKPKRKNVRISTDPQTSAARRRRERISERIRALQKLVPGGSNMDTASVLDEAANYLKFLRTQVNALEALGFNIDPIIINNNFTSFSSIPFSYPFPMQPNFPLQNLNPIHRPKC